jgi:hypothetical protein
MLFIHIVKINTELGEFDWFSDNDLSIEITYGCEKRTTTIKWNISEPIWNEAFIFKYNPSVKYISFRIFEANSLVISHKDVKEIIEVPVEHENIKLIESYGIEFYMGDIHFQKDKEINELLEENETAGLIMAERKIEVGKYIKLTKELTRRKLELESKVKELTEKLKDISYIVNRKI